MAATNFTPIILYHTTTASAAPTAGNLNNGELAINITDGKLFYKDNGGTVQVIATKGTGTIGGSNTQVQYNSSGALAGSANFTFNGTTATINTLNLTNALGTAYGGTALTTYTQGDLVYASAANTLAKLGIGANTYILTSTGSVPQWSAPSAVTVATANNLAGGAAGSVPYQSGASTTTFLSIGSAGQVLTSSGSAPQWSNLSSLGVTSLSFGTTGLTPSTATQGAITVAGTLATTNGGTGLTSFTANGVFYASSTSAVGQSANLTFDGTTLVASNLTDSSLTSGRVTYATTGGNLTDSANLTFNGTTLSLTGLNNTGNTTLGDAAADTVTVNGTITSNLIFTDNTYDIGASGATRPRNLFLAGNATLAGTDSAARYIVNSTSNAGTTDISLGSYSSGAWLNSPSGTTGYLAIGGNGILSWSGSTVDVPVGRLTVSGTGSRGVRLRGGGDGSVDIAGDGTTYAIGLNFYNSTSYSTALSGIYVYGSGGAYQYMSLGGTAYNNGGIYIDSNKKVGILKLPSAQFDSINTVSMQNAQSTGLGYGAAITQGTGTLTMAAGSGNQRGNLMTIYGAQGSPTTTIPFGQNYDSIGLNVAMDLAAGGGYGVTGASSYVRTDGSGYAFRANMIQTNGTPGTYNIAFFAESVSGANLNYGVYQSGSSTYNYFNGWVGVGANSLPYGNTTYERMTIEGNTNTRSWLSIRNVNSGSGSYAGVVVNAYGNSWAFEMGSTAANSNALNITKDIYGTPQVMAYMATSGVMTFYGDNGNRPVQIGGGYTQLKGETGGWQIGYYTQDSAGTRKGGFGAAGSNTTQDYNFIGPDGTNTFARFNANGIGVAGTTPSTSGVGITFPSSASISSGANTLDDYEEGTWTPTFTSDGGTTGTTTVTNRWGRYVKIGQQVTVTFGFDGSLSGFSGVLFVGNTPFFAILDSTYQFGGSFEVASSTATGADGASYMFFAYSNALYPRFTTGQQVGYLFVGSTQVNGVTRMCGSMTYLTNL